MTNLDTILKEIDALEYPPGMKKMENRVPGIGFFPGMQGVSDEFKQAKKTIIVLGQDQDRKEGFEKSKGKNGEEYTPTWRHLHGLFKKVGINPMDCFFTNCLLGVREGASKNTGKSPGFAYPEFVERCAQLLYEEFKFIQPRIILCLGLIPFRFLGLLSKEVLLRGICLDEFKELDKWGFQMINERSLLKHPVQIVVLCHPSYRKLNVKYRKYIEFEGEQAEIQLLKDALANAKSTI